MKNLIKITALLIGASLLFSCAEKPDDGSTDDPNGGIAGQKSFSITVDKDVIQSNGIDAATLTVLLDGQDVTSESIIYNEKNEVIELNDGKFTTTQNGEYKFWASYGTEMTYDKKKDDSGLVAVKAISLAVPEVLADNQASNTSFVHRAFLTQFTGTGCGYCPYMIKVVRELMADNTIPDKAVHVAVHSYSNSDPAYIAAPKVSSYPYMNVNFDSGFSHTQGSAALYSLIYGMVAQDAKAGVSVNPVFYEDESTLVVRVSVKAAVDGEYRVGLWLLEDDIYGAQSDYDGIGDSSYNTHENCARRIDSKHDGEWTGKPLGSIKAGKTADKTFVMNVNKDWKVENLHLAVIVSSKEGSNFVVCNAIDCKIDEPAYFEYK